MPRARAPSMSRRRRGPRAARGPTAARGLSGSYAGPDRGRQRAPILSPSVPPSLPRAVPSGRQRGRGIRGSWVQPGVTVAGPGHPLSALAVGRACRRACGSPARSCRELHPGLDSARTPDPQRPRGSRRSLPGRGGSALGGRAWAPAGRSAAPGLAWGRGLGNLRSSGLRSWKFPFASLHSGPRGGISRPCCVAKKWGVSSAFEGRRPGRDAPLCTVCKGHFKDRALFNPCLAGAARSGLRACEGGGGYCCLGRTGRRPLPPASLAASERRSWWIFTGRLPASWEPPGG